MKTEYVWVNWSDVDYKKFPFRNSWKSVAGTYEFPVDRFGIATEWLELPTRNIVKQPVYNLENLTMDFEDRYYATLDMVADKIYKQAGDTKKINLLYSGGVDSVCAFAALHRHPKFKEFLEQDRFAISLTSISIDEYPFLFYTVILPSVPIMPLDYVKLMADPDTLLVTGDMGDYIIGSSDVVSLTDHDATYNVMQPWNTIVPYIKNYDNHEHYLELLVRAKRNQPFQLDSANQLVWWMSQCFCFQDELARPYIWSEIDDYSTMHTDEKVYRFFYDDLLTTFSYEYMSTNPDYEFFDNTRFWPKKYIVNHFGDFSYYEKVKIYSQRLTLRTVNATRIYYESDILKHKSVGNVI